MADTQDIANSLGMSAAEFESLISRFVAGIRPDWAIRIDNAIKVGDHERVSSLILRPLMDRIRRVENAFNVPVGDRLQEDVSLGDAWRYYSSLNKWVKH